MSITRYCDGCGKTMADDDGPTRTPALHYEIDASGSNSGAWPKRKITVQVTRAVDDAWNAGEVCRYCLIQVITTVHLGIAGTLRTTACVRDHSPHCVPAATR